MRLERGYDAASRKHRLYAEWDDDYILKKCTPHPAAHLINDEQAAGIIEDAILLACGMELKR